MQLGNTGLALAASLGHTAVARCLLRAGADKEAVNHDGATPLIAAAMSGHAAVALLLINAGANKEAKDNVGAVWARYHVPRV